MGSEVSNLIDSYYTALINNHTGENIAGELKCITHKPSGCCSRTDNAASVIVIGLNGWKHIATMIRSYLKMLFLLWGHAFHM